METNCINLKTNNKTDMSTTYLSVDYFPLTVNFFDRDAIELAEAKYGIRVDGAESFKFCLTKDSLTKKAMRSFRY